MPLQVFARKMDDSPPQAEIIARNSLALQPLPRWTRIQGEQAVKAPEGAFAAGAALFALDQIVREKSALARGAPHAPARHQSARGRRASRAGDDSQARARRSRRGARDDTGRGHRPARGPCNRGSGLRRITWMNQAGRTDSFLNWFNDCRLLMISGVTHAKEPRNSQTSLGYKPARAGLRRARHLPRRSRHASGG